MLDTPVIDTERDPEAPVRKKKGMTAKPKKPKEGERPKREPQLIHFTPRHEKAMKAVQDWYGLVSANDAVRFSVMRAWRRGQAMQKAGKMPTKHLFAESPGKAKILQFYPDDVERLRWLQWFHACDSRRETVLLAVAQEAENLAE